MFIEVQKDIPKLSTFASWAMINPLWLELPMSGTNFHGPKHVRFIEVRLQKVKYHIYHIYSEILIPYNICFIFYQIRFTTC